MSPCRHVARAKYVMIKVINNNSVFSSKRPCLEPRGWSSALAQRFRPLGFRALMRPRYDAGDMLWVDGPPYRAKYVMIKVINNNSVFSSKRPCLEPRGWSSALAQRFRPLGFRALMPSPV